MSDEQNKDLSHTKTLKKKRVRSPYLFPAYDFGLAKQIAETVENSGGGNLSEETLAITLRLSTKSSGFQLKTLTARQFGLLTKHGNLLSTTPLAKSIFKPTDENEKQRALAQSFLHLPLFREVANRFKGQPLPQGETLRNVLEREFKIDAKRISDAERVLMDSARDTGVLVTVGNNIYLLIEQATQTTTVRKKDVNDTNQISLIPPLPSTTPPSSSGTMLTINLEEHLAPFDDHEFQQIWDALGKIIRVKGNKQQTENNIEQEG